MAGEAFKAEDRKMGIKQIIAFDFDGSIISSIAGKEAHFEWFEIMSNLLKDKRIKELADKKDYFPDVYRIMEKYTGLVHKDNFDKEIMTKMARNLYQLAFLGIANKHKDILLFKEIAELILQLRKEFTIALITTTPEDIVLPIMHLMNFEKPDIIQTTPITEKPSKINALKRFVKEHGKPIIYVGNSTSDIDACRELKIKSALATWGDYDKDAVGKADYVAKDAVELKKIILNLQ